MRLIKSTHATVGARSVKADEDTLDYEHTLNGMGSRHNRLPSRQLRKDGHE